MDLGLQDKVIIVAGRGAAIENEIALVLTQAGAHVIVISNIWADDHTRSHVLHLINNKFGRVEGLVNCAGESDNMGSLAEDYLITQCTLPYLKSAQGTILNVSYGNRDRSTDFTQDCAAANGGREALTREWAVELLNSGIRVNAIIVEVSHLKYPDASSKIANAAAFFLSARASHVTGQLIHLFPSV